MSITLTANSSISMRSRVANFPLTVDYHDQLIEACSISPVMPRSTNGCANRIYINTVKTYAHTS